MYYTLGQIDGFLADSRERVSRLMQTSPFRDRVARLSVQQTRLEEIRRRAGQGQGQNLGFIIAAGIGLGIAGLTALGIRAWQHREEAKVVQAETDLIMDLVAKGNSLEDIARVYGDKKSSLDTMLSRVIILTALIGGIIVYLKLK